MSENEFAAFHATRSRCVSMGINDVHGKSCGTYKKIEITSIKGKPKRIIRGHVHGLELDEEAKGPFFMWVHDKSDVSKHKLTKFYEVLFNKPAVITKFSAVTMEISSRTHEPLPFAVE